MSWCRSLLLASLYCMVGLIFVFETLSKTTAALGLKLQLLLFVRYPSTEAATTVSYLLTESMYYKCDRLLVLLLTIMVHGRYTSTNCCSSRPASSFAAALQAWSTTFWFS
jgi:hypothetical protein